LAGGVIVALVRFGGPSDSVVTAEASSAEPFGVGDIEPAPA
jgi:hypothetical protein